MSNLLESGMMPVESLGKLSDMFQRDKVYEVMVEDRMNPGSKRFSFGINGRIGDYPTNSRIRLRGDEIQHLYNCIYEEPITEQSTTGFNVIVGKRQVCRFSITPTSWDSLPTRAVLLQPQGVVATREDTSISAIPTDAPEITQVGQTETGKDISNDDLMAAREKELEAMDWDMLKSVAQERGVKLSGTKKSEVIKAILKIEQAVLEGTD